MDSDMKLVLDCHNEELEDETLYDKICFVCESDWVSDHKYQFKETVYKFNDRYFEVSETRTGSHHSDYYYEDPEIYEVVPKQVTKTTWVKK